MIETYKRNVTIRIKLIQEDDSVIN
jgi:hypothetical protein